MPASNGRIWTHCFQQGVLNYKGLCPADEAHALMYREWIHYIDPPRRATPHEKAQTSQILYRVGLSFFKLLTGFIKT